MWVLNIYEILPAFHCSVGGRGLKIFYLFPVVVELGPSGYFLNSMSLSDKMYLGHM